MTTTHLPARWSGDDSGWISSRYPRTNNASHLTKLLRYPPHGNVDEWVDHGPDGASTTEEVAP